MKLMTEKKSGEFLRKKGFNLLCYEFVSKKKNLKKAIEKIGFPCVIKVSGDKIIHKKRIQGVYLNIKTINEAENIFEKLIKIPNSQGVIIQPQIKAQEIFLGIKKTKDFGHAIAFGKGGSNVEDKKDIAFRIFPVLRTDAIRMIKDTKISKKLSTKEREIILNLIEKFNYLIKEHPSVKELDINPFMIQGDIGFIVDSRILFE